MTQSFLKDAFNYDQKSGNLVWRVDRPADHFATTVGHKVYLKQWAGKRAGTKYKDKTSAQCVVISFKGRKKRFSVHKLVFFYHFGYVPELIDHINGNPHDNKVENLQPLNYSLNTAKASMFSHNTSGYRGCRYRKRDNKWIVNLKVNKYGYYLGQYSDLEYAAAVYNKFSKLIFGDCAYINNTNINLDDVDITNTFTEKHLPNLIKNTGFSDVRR